MQTKLKSLNSTTNTSFLLESLLGLAEGKQITQQLVGFSIVNYLGTWCYLPEILSVTSKSQAVTIFHFRLYYRTKTCMPLKPQEINQDSEDEITPQWLCQKSVNVGYTAVNIVTHSD